MGSGARRLETLSRRLDFWRRGRGEVRPEVRSGQNLFSRIGPVDTVPQGFGVRLTSRPLYERALLGAPECLITVEPKKPLGRVPGLRPPAPVSRLSGKLPRAQAPRGHRRRPAP